MCFSLNFCHVAKKKEEPILEQQIFPKKIKAMDPATAGSFSTTDYKQGQNYIQKHFLLDRFKPYIHIIRDNNII